MFQCDSLRATFVTLISTLYVLYEPSSKRLKRNRWNYFGVSCLQKIPEHLCLCQHFEYWIFKYLQPSVRSLYTTIIKDLDWRIGQVKLFKCCLPQILLGPFLDTLTHFWLDVVTHCNFFVPGYVLVVKLLISLSY